MKCTVYYNDTSETLTPNKMSFFEEVYFDYKTVNQNGAEKISLFIHPKQTIQLAKITLEISYNFTTSDKLLCNGFQSWSETKTYTINEKIPRLRSIAKPYFKYYGDEYIFDSYDRPDLFSWTYGYVQRENEFLMIASIQEQTAFSLIEYDIPANVIRITKLCDNIELNHSFPAMDIMVDKGAEHKVFDNYFKALGSSPKELKPTFGYTSWYRHYNKITEEKILRDLKSFSDHTNIEPFNQSDRIFQIDDGYQSEIGDWITPNDSFPKGMNSIAKQITDRGLVPGIWIAPFVCSKNSKIFNQHQTWLLKNKNGKPLRAGYNPLWGGWYFALDIYNPQVKEYLTEVCFTIFNKWSFQLVKADFLFAACIAPPIDKTRGQVMHDAMTFLDQLVGQHRLLACGVPLGSTFHHAHYCRIGPDTHLAWDHSLLRFLRKRERVSTISALRTIIHRRHLSYHVFINDPDVFIMRATGHQLNAAQQYTILLVQILFGHQIFNSDDWSSYSTGTIDEIKGLLSFRQAHILSCAEPHPDYYQVSFKTSILFTAHINLSKKKVPLTHPVSDGYLAPFESLVLKNQE